MADRLNPEGLRYAQAVAETRSFSAAARAYGVTQPALSNGIARLEEALGVRLFDRSPRGVSPTAQGAALLPLIDRALSGLDAVTAEAVRMTASPAQTVRMGVSPLIGSHLVARAFRAVRGLSEACDLVLREADMGALRQGLLDDELDLVLIPAVAPLPRFQHQIIDSEPVVVIDPASDGTPLEVADAGAEPYILVADTCGLTSFTKQLFTENRVPMKQYEGEAASYRVLEEWARFGLGSAILPKSKLSSPTATYRPLVEDGSEVEIFYEAVWRPECPLTPVVEQLVEDLRGR